MKFVIIKHIFRLIVVYTTIIMFSIACNTTNSDRNYNVKYPVVLAKFHENVINYYLNSEIDDRATNILIENLQEDGSWSTIDYSNKVRGGWPVKNHLLHVQNLAIHYKNKTSRFYKDKDVLHKIHRALNYWLNNDFLSTNWHDQHIGVPELLLPTLFLMENELSKQQLDKAIVLLNRAKIKMSGQNKVWLSTNVMLRSLLLRKQDSVSIASKAIQDELKIANGVGVKPDWSYHEHGAQLQFGNYGLSYLEDMIKCYTFVNNTPFQFEDSKIEFLRDYVLKGQQWVIWNNTYDVNASGRQLFLNEQEKKAARLKRCLEQMKLLDTAHAKAYEDVLNTKTLSGNKHFWKSDFHVHRRQDFYFSVKMSSKRVIGTESVNQENIQGYYMGDGVALLSTHNEAYRNVFPFWDWKKLPGTTIIQDTLALPIIKFSGFKTNGTFVGGVSNGKNGIAVMDYNRDGLAAKKSWFMFNDKVICLGSGITTNSDFPVTTTLNQSFLKGSVLVSENNSVTRTSRVGVSQEIDWVLHDHIGYLFPNKGQVKLSTQILEGSWNNVAKRYRPVILTENIFKLGLAHGKQPKNEKYEYILVPNASKDTMIHLNKNKPFKIVNTQKIQSVESIDGTWAGIAFFKEGVSKVYGGITVNKPCVLMLEHKENALVLSVSDPSHSLNKIKVNLKGYYIFEGSTYSNGQTQLTIHLPQGEQAGKTVFYHLSK
ncbi:polysaccharide lyase 8 family protein [Algibacter pectinivorans]|uniref:Chondroitin AC lyase n=1 Tax=Algibacter pectinivorans TaxID=870482 RepID=A0A1I1R0H6_9FLAO|nr:polysaccharide lyase 8 family protein [Algibacter pectinivorans]SFD27856.1 chondroitin AC lyase [Algibacter pectinivorans]